VATFGKGVGRYQEVWTLNQKCMRGVSIKLAERIIGHFTYLVGIVIVFYFGSSGVREYLKFKERCQSLEEKQKVCGRFRLTPVV